MQKLILASASPRRRELLANLGLSFTVSPSSMPEPAYTGSDPGKYAAGLAADKAAQVAEDCREGLVVGADTIVVLDGQVLGKPQDYADAVRMLTMLSGRTHLVYTGIAVIDAATGRTQEETAVTQVTFRNLEDWEITAYVDSGEPLDKAGAYGIQGLGALLVDGIQGCFFNVVGLPLSALNRLLGRFGFAILQMGRDGDRRTV